MDIRTKEKAQFVALIVMWIVLVGALILGVIFNSGCAGRQAKLRDPGCSLARIQVPQGCYAQPLPDGVQVRCPDGTVTYKCITK